MPSRRQEKRKSLRLNTYFIRQLPLSVVHQTFQYIIIETLFEEIYYDCNISS